MDDANTYQILQLTQTNRPKALRPRIMYALVLSANRSCVTC